MPLQYIFEYNLSYLNNYGNKLKEKDTYCHSCRQPFQLGDLIHSKFSSGAVDHIKRHVSCSIQKIVITEKEAIHLAPESVKDRVKTIAYHKHEVLRKEIGVLPLKTAR